MIEVVLAVLALLTPLVVFFIRKHWAGKEEDRLRDIETKRRYDMEQLWRREQADQLRKSNSSIKKQREEAKRWLDGDE